MADPRPRHPTGPQSRPPLVPSEPLRGILDGDLASAGTATVRVTVFDGDDWIETGETATVREILGVSAAIPAGTRVVALKFGVAGWCVISASCPAEE